MDTEVLKAALRELTGSLAMAPASPQKPSRQVAASPVRGAFLHPSLGSCPHPRASKPEGMGDLERKHALSLCGIPGCYGQ